MMLWKERKEIFATKFFEKEVESKKEEKKERKKATSREVEIYIFEAY